MRTRRKSCDNRWTKEQKFNSDSFLNLKKKKIEKKNPIFSRKCLHCNVRNGTIERAIFFLLSWTKVQIRLAFTRGYGGGWDDLFLSVWCMSFQFCIQKKNFESTEHPYKPPTPFFNLSMKINLTCIYYWFSLKDSLFLFPVSTVLLYHEETLRENN